MPGAPLTDPGVRFDRTGLFKVGDRRRTQRLVTVTTALAQNPNGTLPTTFTNWKDLRAAYRLFAETDVTHDAIVAPHTQRVVQACQVPGEYLLIEDTTTLSFNTHPARRIVGCYIQRWLIEEFHKALKTGTQVEASQLATGRALEALGAVLSLVALRLLETKLYARAFPDQPVRPGQFALELIRLLAARVGRPHGGWTQRTVWRGIARCGGFLARRGDGEPGWITI